MFLTLLKVIPSTYRPCNHSTRAIRGREKVDRETTKILFLEMENPLYIYLDVAIYTHLACFILLIFLLS